MANGLRSVVGMENNGTVSASAALGPDRLAEPGNRSAAEWVGLVSLAIAVLVAGVLVGLLGPLFAIACDSCQDGVRSPQRFGDALIAIAQGAVPLTVVATVAGMFLPRGGARVGGIGLGVLVLLLIVMLAIGEAGA